MNNRLLLRTQTNQVYELIREQGLNPDEFEWHKIDGLIESSYTINKLVHEPTGYYFIFDIDRDGEFWCEFSPSESKPVEIRNSEIWDIQTVAVYEWLKFLKRELDEPDLWGILSGEKILLDTITNINDKNEKFTDDEIKLISQNIEELKEFLISKQEFNEHSIKFIESNLAYLVDASSRLGKKDWITITLGIIANIIISLSLNTNIAREFLHKAGELFKWLIESHKLLN